LLVLIYIAPLQANSTQIVQTSQTQSHTNIRTNKMLSDKRIYV